MPQPFNFFIPGKPNPFYVPTPPPPLPYVPPPPPQPNSTPATTVLPNSAPTPAPSSVPTPVPEPGPINIFYSTPEEIAIWHTAYRNWQRSQGLPAPAPAPAPAPESDQYSISNQLQQGMNALMQGEEPPPFSQPQPPGPNFLEDYTPILEELPNYTSREELMENYAIPDDSWTGEMANREDNIFQGLADVFDPNRNGVADAFDPNQNGVADFFNQLTQPEEEEKKSSMNLLLLGAGALILVYALM